MIVIDTGPVVAAANQRRRRTHAPELAHVAIAIGASMSARLRLGQRNGGRGTTRAFGRKGLKLRGLARFCPGEFEFQLLGQLAVA